MTSRQHSPALVLSGFLLLLAAMFGVAYAAGAAAGPVAPGMHRGGGGGDSGGSGGGMGDMHGMSRPETGVYAPGTTR
ncbi:hypothetical protein LRS74_05115 [Streptomyces sp. LX-29]|uniref:hypothetical protein n=1 Tax=Streptomyces sp. LX-29 TaxID=2900152 RepID=UPI00240DAAEA|nr:hypothetical protein [Streptomyces sp. LX-29]WFB06491.1 hypothetical protein LRS74_05115 [Streptomyces sp. LX-29]